MATETKYYAQAAAIFGQVDEADEAAVKEFFELKLPALGRDVVDAVMSFLLYFDGVDADSPEDSKHVMLGIARVVDRLSERVDSMSERVDSMWERVDSMSDRLDRMSDRFERMEALLRVVALTTRSINEASPLARRRRFGDEYEQRLPPLGG